jgi:hypothetical protein
MNVLILGPEPDPLALKDLLTKDFPEVTFFAAKKEDEDFNHRNTF